MRNTIHLIAKADVLPFPPAFARSQEMRGANVETLWIPTGLLAARGLEARLAFDFLATTEVRHVVVVDDPDTARVPRTLAGGEIQRVLEWRTSEGTRVLHVRAERAPRSLELSRMGATDVFESLRATRAGTLVRTTSRVAAEHVGVGGRSAQEPARSWLERATFWVRTALAPLAPLVAAPPLAAEVLTTVCGATPPLAGRWAADSGEPRAVECDALAESADGGLTPLRWARARRSLRGGHAAAHAIETDPFAVGGLLPGWNAPC
ncbi:MAG: hypothetical protein GY711_28700 [bacterium]|nr:hypothetical protein [bacterium]